MNKITFIKDGHKYFNEHDIQVESVSEILEHFGIADYSHVNEKVLKAAQDFGIVVHDTCYLSDIDDLAECDPQVEPYLFQWQKFLSDHHIPWDEFDLIEKPLYSKIWGFAGTPDRIFLDKIIDIKTGQPSLAHKIQKAMYQILAEENLDIKIKERWTVYLTANDYKVVEHKDKEDVSIAKSLVALFNWKKREGLL